MIQFFFEFYLMADSVRSGNAGGLAILRSSHRNRLVIEEFFYIFVVFIFGHIIVTAIEILHGLGRGHEWRRIHARAIAQMVVNMVMMVLNALAICANLDHGPQTGIILQILNQVLMMNRGGAGAFDGRELSTPSPFNRADTG